MFTDLFWTIATSIPALLIVAVILTAALVVGYFPLLKWAPIVGQYVKPAKLVAFLFFGLLTLLIGVRITDEREEAKSLRDQLAAKTIDLQVTHAASDRKDKDIAKLKVLATERQKRITDYAELRKARANGACAITADDLAGVSNRR